MATFPRPGLFDPTAGPLSQGRPQVQRDQRSLTDPNFLLQGPGNLLGNILGGPGNFISSILDPIRSFAQEGLIDPILGFEDDESRSAFGRALLANANLPFGQAVGTGLQQARQQTLLQQREIDRREQLDLQRLNIESQIRAREAPEALGGPLVTLRKADGTEQTLRRDDPQVNPLLAQGATVVRTPAVDVNLSTGSEKAFAKGVGEVFAGEFKQATEAATTSRRILARSSIFSRLLDQGAETGATAPITKPIAAVLRDLGFNVGEDVPIQEAIENIAIDFTLDFISRTKGAISEREMSLFANAAPGLARTLEGNRIIIEVLTAMAQRDIDRAEVWRRGVGAGKQGFEISQEVAAFEDANPIITPALSARIDAAQAGPIGGGGDGDVPIPQDLPPGSQFIGRTQRGFPIFETPDGRRFVDE